MATGPQTEMPFVAPVSLSAASQGDTNYRLVMSRDLVDFSRDNAIPTIFVQIEPDLMHTYRIEHIGNKLYRFLIDGMVIDSGVPEGPYPIASSFIIWRSFCSQAPNMTTWDYVVFGTLESEAVPATSQWGLAVMALLTLTAATLVFRSRPRRQAA